MTGNSDKAGPLGDVSLAIQVGGSSRRMGEDKAFLDFGGVSLLQWIRDRVSRVFEHVFLVANEPERYRRLGLPVVTDAVAERGAIGGIYTAVLASPTPRVLCLACDLPFVTPKLLRHLSLGSDGYDVFVPREGPYLQPLCAVYSRDTAAALEEFIERGERRVDRFFGGVRTGYLDVDDGTFGDPEVVFLNLNTPEDLDKARALLQSGRDPLAGGFPEDGHASPDSSEPDGLKLRVRELSDRVQSFEARAPLPVVSFVGKKKSGKTTVLIRVIQELARRGFRVAVVKHDVHGFDVDVPGTDSYRLRQAGAVVAGISSPEKYVWINEVEEELSLLELSGQITEPVDVLLTEGFKRQNAAKIEVCRRERSTEMICPADELIGVASDQSFPDLPVPVLTLDDAKGLSDLIAEYAGLRGRESAAPGGGRGHPGEEQGVSG